MGVSKNSTQPSVSSLMSRQKQLSVWTIVAIIQNLAWLYLLPMICRPYWADLFRSLSPAMTEIVLTVVPNFSLLTLYTLAMIPVYYLRHPFFEQYKIQPEKVWPWQAESSKARAEFWELTFRSMRFTLFNGFILVPASILAKLSMNELLNQPQLSFSDEDWPTFSEMIVQSILLTIVHEFGFYVSHRAMHSYPSLYKYHKVHHEYKLNNVLASQHNHPVDYLFSICLPAAMAVSVVSPRHSFVQFQWTIWAVWTNLDDHCGYSFPWSPVRWFPTAAETDEHEFHHAKNMGCFGSKLDIYNKLLGGYKHYGIWKQERSEKQKNFLASGRIVVVDAIIKQE